MHLQDQLRMYRPDCPPPGAAPLSQSAAVLRTLCFSCDASASLRIADVGNSTTWHMNLYTLDSEEAVSAEQPERPHCLRVSLCRANSTRKTLALLGHGACLLGLKRLRSSRLGRGEASREVRLPAFFLREREGVLGADSEPMNLKGVAASGCCGAASSSARTEAF